MKRLGNSQKVITIIFCSFLLLSILPVVGWNAVWAAGSVYRVDHSATGLETGLNWGDAFLTLQDALDVATAGDEIWVAAGVYKPTKRTDLNDDRTATFQLVEGVAIYGGFAGGETHKTDRNWELNKTILSGDLDNNDNVDGIGVTPTFDDINGNGNAYNLIRGDDAITYTNATVLDGFILTGGSTKSGGADYEERDGAAIRFREYASPVLRNLQVIGNKSTDDGGAIHFLHNSSPILENVTVESATAGDFGGGIYFESDNSPTFSNVTVKDTTGRRSAGIYLHDNNNVIFANLYVCNNASSETANNGGNGGSGLSIGSNNIVKIMNGVFSANVSSNENGGGFRMKGDNDVDLHNVTLSGNQANSGGGIYIRNSGNIVTLTNSIVWGNSSEIDSGAAVALAVNHSLISNSANPYTGTGNVSSAISPFVTDPSGGDCGDLRLKASAATVDSGSNAGLPADSLDINSNNDTAEDLPLDLDDQFRIYNSTVDMGAYEISVTPTAQTITFTLSAAAQSGLGIGNQENLMATASSGLTVVFESDSPSICSVVGTTATMLDSGICSITASQLGNGTYAAAPEVTRSIIVSEESKVNQTITLTNPVDSSVAFVNDTISLIASSTSNLPVSFSSGTPSICSVSGSNAMMIQAGTCVINANQAGDETYNPASQKSASVTVEKRNQTITFINPEVGTNSVVGENVSLSATSDSGLTVAFSSNSPSVCSVSGDSASMLAQGNCELVATQEGNGEYKAAVAVIRSVAVGSVSKLNQTITFNTPADLDEATLNDVLSLSATASSGLQVSFALGQDSDDKDICDIAGSLVVMKNYGVCQIVASQQGR